MRHGRDVRSADPAQLDIIWAGYDPRAMLPAIALAAIASLVVWTGRWYLEDLSDLADAVGDWAIFALAWAVWPALVVAFLYKTVMHTYRLTNRVVLVDYGRFSRPVAPIPLETITDIEVRGAWLLRKLGIGRVELRTADRVVILKGVRNPLHFADRIRTARAELHAHDRMGSEEHRE